MEELQAKKYVWFVLSTIIALVISVALVSYYLHQRDIPYTENGFIRQYQMQKLVAVSGVQTIFIGDSSTGNAIDAQLWSTLSGVSTLNLALNGGFGIEGSYNMIRQALRREPIKNVIIMQTLDLWHRGPSVEGYFDTRGDLPNPQFKDVDVGRALSVRSELPYLFNPNEIFWYARYLVRGFDYSWTFENDYFAQSSIRFSNGTATIKYRVIPDEITPMKKEFYLQIDRLCAEQRLNCIYVHGPTHDVYATSSKVTIEHIDAFLLSAPHIHVITKLFAYPPEMMGDSPDHVDPSQKDRVTRQYFDTIKTHLR